MQFFVLDALNKAYIKACKNRCVNILHLYLLDICLIAKCFAGKYE